MPQSSTLAEGETVNVKIPGAVVVTPDPLVVRVGDEDLTVPTDAEVTVTSPANWPPQMGDTWHAGTPARPYFAVVDGGKLKMQAHDDAAKRVTLAELKAMRPVVLAFRGPVPA